MPIYALPSEPIFPPVSHAEPDGLLAVGGDLTPERILAAYSQGIFPWYSNRSPILWWSPDPRMVLLPEELAVSKSMQQLLKREAFQVTGDRAFAEVIAACANAPRPSQTGTWLNKNMQKAYLQLHQIGHAHSVEVWQDGQLVGGLYGMVLGKIFCGESMFARVSNASKYGFITLVRALQQQGFGMIDCQVHTDHLQSLGAREIPRNEFIHHLETAILQPPMSQPWSQLFLPTDHSQGSLLK